MRLEQRASESQGLGYSLWPAEVERAWDWAAALALTEQPQMVQEQAERSRLVLQGSREGHCGQHLQVVWEPELRQTGLA